MLFSGPLYYSTIKMNQLLIQTSTSMDFQGIMLSKKKKSQPTRLHIFNFYLCNIIEMTMS